MDKISKGEIPRSVKPHGLDTAEEGSGSETSSLSSLVARRVEAIEGICTADSSSDRSGTSSRKGSTTLTVETSQRPEAVIEDLPVRQHGPQESTSSVDMVRMFENLLATSFENQEISINARDFHYSPAASIEESREADDEETATEHLDSVAKSEGDFALANTEAVKANLVDTANAKVDRISGNDSKYLSSLSERSEPDATNQKKIPADDGVNGLEAIPEHSGELEEDATAHSNAAEPVPDARNGIQGNEPQLSSPSELGTDSDQNQREKVRANINDTNEDLQHGRSILPEHDYNVSDAVDRSSIHSSEYSDHHDSQHSDASSTPEKPAQDDAFSPGFIRVHHAELTATSENRKSHMGDVSMAERDQHSNAYGNSLPLFAFKPESAEQNNAQKRASQFSVDTISMSSVYSDPEKPPNKVDDLLNDMLGDLTRQQDLDEESLPKFTKQRKRYSNQGQPAHVEPWMMPIVEELDFNQKAQQPRVLFGGSASTSMSGGNGSGLAASSKGLSFEEEAIEDEEFKDQWMFEKYDRIELEISTPPRQAADPDFSPPGPASEDTFPEGGLRGWLVVLGGFCGMFAALGLAGTLGAFQTYFLEHQLAGYSPGNVGWIFSIFTFMVFGCGVYIGPLFDVYGPKWLLIPGSVLLVLMIFVLPLCKGYWSIFFVFGGLGGLGSSLIFTPCIAAPGHYFNRRRGNATGIVSAGGAIGGIFYPVLMEKLIPKIGFAWTMRFMGLVMIIMLGLAILLIKPRLPRTARKPHPDFRILSDMTFSATIVGVFLLEMGIFIPLTYITSYARAAGFSYDFAFAILPIINVGSAFGRWLPGFCADKIGRYNTVIIFTFLTLISIFALWLPFGATKPGLVIFALLFGFATGSNISLAPVCIGQLCDGRDYGRYYATCYSIVSIGCLIGIPIAGWILESTMYQYWSLIVWTGCCYAYALIAILIARGLGGGWSFKAAF